MYVEQRRKQSSSESLSFKPVLEYMSENIDKTVKVDQLAALVYMQPTYFIRRFSKIFDLSPIAYFNRMKMYKAMGMLASTDMPIEKIARDIGITDTSYFARLFKKHSSVTPSEYRAEFQKSR